MAPAVSAGRVGPADTRSHGRSFCPTWSGLDVGVYLPISLARNAEPYGGIGVAISLVYWLIIINALVVSVAVVGAELASRLRPADKEPGER